MAMTVKYTWTPPLASPAEAPRGDDKQRYAVMKMMLIESLEFSNFRRCDYLDFDNVSRRIYEEASNVVGRKLPYPGDQ